MWRNAWSREWLDSGQPLIRSSEFRQQLLRRGQLQGSGVVRQGYHEPVEIGKNAGGSLMLGRDVCELILAVWKRIHVRGVVSDGIECGVAAQVGDSLDQELARVLRD